jgi:hypothetical protein
MRGKRTARRFVGIVLFAVQRDGGHSCSDWLDVLVATALVAVFMNERFPAAFVTIAAVINVGVRPFRE